ncbi:B3 domain-containing protein [Platanthera guangdongensis]|uniref:B3 domain-containing protein n=1 Tax=Platanthera guangdongensis TaxID=2320717 RepID=A0ABR2MTR0_9ASPA
MANLQFIVKFTAADLSDTLAFPPKLVCTSKEMDRLDNNIYLTGPGGKQCGVKLLKRGGLLYLEDGWKEFIQDHYVMEGDRLVFKYHGNSCFSVLIFDKSGCERESSYFVKNDKESASNQLLQAHQIYFPQNSGDNENHDDAQPSPNEGRSSGGFYTSETSLSKRTTLPDQSCKFHETEIDHINKYASKFRSCRKTRIETEIKKETTKIKGSKSEARALRFTKSNSIKNPYFVKVLPAGSVLKKYSLINTLKATVAAGIIGKMRAMVGSRAVRWPKHKRRNLEGIYPHVEEADMKPAEESIKMSTSEMQKNYKQMLTEKSAREGAEEST